ncbi:conserved hypothetical protein [Ricinus communis]|uniref:Uncharacterized protein n=1 Tax=Ricinus communis TaxID=3988 RepID=B9T966_RICCO|nr:conserved hypothetical protein [Ricinus communis]
MRAAMIATDVQNSQSSFDQVVQTRRRERTKRGAYGDKQGARDNVRSHLFQVSQNCFTYLGCKRVVLIAPLLWTADVKDVMFPVHVVQSQGNDFTPSQSVDREEQQNGAVPDIMGTVRIGAANESLHVFPLRPGWKRLVAEQTRSFDTGGESLRAPGLLTGVAEETSQHAGKGGHRYPGTSLAFVSAQKRRRPVRVASRRCCILAR